MMILYVFIIFLPLKCQIFTRPGGQAIYKSITNFKERCVFPAYILFSVIFTTRQVLLNIIHLLSVISYYFICPANLNPGDINIAPLTPRELWKSFTNQK